jgi:ATP-dependent helicase/nuclease subunit B
MYDWLDGALQESSEVITASRRLARVLQQEYSQQMLAKGETVWRSASILSLQDWLSRLVADSTDPASLPVQITAQQSRLLWERCLRREISDPLLNLGMLSRQSRDTWKRLREWQVPVQECQRQARNKDQALFAKAAKNYVSILQRENWIDEAGLADLALQEILADRCRLAKRLTLAGFDRLSPQLQALIAAIESRTCEVGRTSMTDANSKVSLCSAENSDVELRAAGAWARKQLDQSPRICPAIVVTHLEQGAERSLRLIKEGLIPGWQNADARQNAVINVSYGKKLIEYPAVSIALSALRWLVDDLDTVDVSGLLLSNLFGGRTDDEQCRIELRLRQQPSQTWSPKALLAEISAWSGESEARDDLDLIQCIARQRAALPKQQAPAAWVTSFHEVLLQLRWPGSASLHSSEFQLVNRWRELLNEFARLDLVTSSMSASEALGRISSIASEVIFQPEATNAVVQVLGPLEAAGLRFEKLWVTGISASNWPPNARPMSLVSRDLQRDFGMPDASPADSLAYAERVVARLLASASEVVLSYPQSISDAQQSPSELLEQYAIQDTGAATDPGWNARHLCGEPECRLITEDPVPSVGQGERVAGGAATIQRQFVEPFAAFTIGRLGVRPLWPITSGLPASIRGSLIHGALHQLYKDCPSSEQIKAWDETEIAQRSSRASKAAFWAQERNADAVLRRLLQLERARVELLLHSVIAADSEREGFCISSVEQEYDLDIAGLVMRLRVDRIDSNCSDQLLILDYKTGAPKRLLDRDLNPRDMQLVVYAMAAGAAVGGIGLLNVDSRGIELDAASRELTPKLDWDVALASWQEQVALAASEFAAGDVRINSLQTIQAARPLGLLSRFRELTSE